MVIEQPCDTYEENASLVGKVCHPIYLDESATDLGAVVTAIGQRVADGFGMKVSRVGGITAMRAVRDVCAATRRPHTVDDTWGGDLVAAASLHVGATVDPALRRRPLRRRARNSSGRRVDGPTPRTRVGDHPRRVTLGRSGTQRVLTGVAWRPWAGV